MNIHLGYEVGSGHPIEIPLKHMAVTGQTQEAGKTTALEALIARAGLQAVTFVTKRGEGSFASARRIDPYFREQADWQFVASILEASRGEKLKFERAWIIRASRGARTLADVHRNVRESMKTAKGLSGDVYLTLDAYLEVVVPQIGRTHWASTVRLQPGVNAMDLTDMPAEMQHLVIKSTLDWVLANGRDTVVVVPEAWKFIPQGRGTPVKLAAEGYIRQGAALKNYLWLDSQDIAGIDKIILKSVPLWILGVQREANEIKRTLDNIPVGVKQPAKADIAHLGLGEFFACWGRHCAKTYVQPEWMAAEQAIAVARGEADFNHHPVRRQPKEPEVTKEEADALRAENDQLRREIDQLRGNLARAVDRVGVTTEHVATVAAPIGDTEALYQTIKARLAKDAPALLRVLAVKPELEVRVERRTVQVDGVSLKGRLAQLLSKGFFDDAKTNSATRSELARTGPDVNSANLGRALDAFVNDGFMTFESGKTFKAVEGMKVNIVEG